MSSGRFRVVAPQASDTVTKIRVLESLSLSVAGISIVIVAEIKSNNFPSVAFRNPSMIRSGGDPSGSEGAPIIELGLDVTERYPGVPGAYDDCGATFQYCKGPSLNLKPL